MFKYEIFYSRLIIDINFLKMSQTQDFEHVHQKIVHFLNIIETLDRVKRNPWFDSFKTKFEELNLMYRHNLKILEDFVKF